MMSQDPNLNPYAGGDAGIDPARQIEIAAQETTIPKWIGILNIVFGSILLLCIAGYSLQLLMQGFVGTAMANQKQMEENWEQNRQQQIDDLQAAEDAAEDEETAAEWREARESLENQKFPKMPNMQNMFGMKKPGVVGSYIFDCSTGLLFNVLMIASGIGLLNQREWARKLAIWVASLKVLRLIILTLLTILVVGPAVSQGMGNFVGEEMGEMNPQGMPNAQPTVEQVTKIYNTMFIVYAVMLLIFGSIYPLISLRLLTRPHVVAACKPRQDNIYRADVF